VLFACRVALGAWLLYAGDRFRAITAIVDLTGRTTQLISAQRAGLTPRNSTDSVDGAHRSGQKPHSTARPKLHPDPLGRQT